MPAQGRKPQQQFSFGLVLDRVRHRHAKKRFGITGATRQLDVQLDFLGQRQYLRPFKRIAWQQWRAFVALLDVLENHTGFVDETLFHAQHRHLPARADG
ncbi:hypothetical protein D3C86_1826170 [compost metagenome]